jgi:hypothetical protein
LRNRSRNEHQNFLVCFSGCKPASFCGQAHAI